jgi:hypothetical protein
MPKHPSKSVYIRAKDQLAFAQAQVLGARLGLDASDVVGQALRLWIEGRRLADPDGVNRELGLLETPISPFPPSRPKNGWQWERSEPLRSSSSQKRRTREEEERQRAAEAARALTRSSSGGVTQPWLHTGHPADPPKTLAQYEEQQKELAEHGGQEYVQDLLEKSLAWRQRHLASLAEARAGDFPYDTRWWEQSGWYSKTEDVAQQYEVHVVEDSTEWDADYEPERDPKMEDPGVG